MRLTWPVLANWANPPLPSTPVLFETAVNECSDSFPRRPSAVMIVSVAKRQRLRNAGMVNCYVPATPQSPKPALKIVEPL